MPELPEVETIRHDLNTVLSGKKIKSLKIFSKKSARPSANFLVNNLVARRVKKIQRRGKLLIICLSPLVLKPTIKPVLKSQALNKVSANKSSTADFLLIHLMMTGQLIYLDKRVKLAGGHSLTATSKLNSSKSPKESFASSVGGELPNRYTRVQIDFLGGGKLFFNDLRKFGYLKLVDKLKLKSLLSNYGPEPLSSDFSFPAFQSLLKSKTTKIKALLLNQKLIAGLGNIYVDESLWLAKLNPERPANNISLSETKKLYQAINKIIKQAISYRGTTFNNYVDSRGQKGNFSRFLKVYGRAGQTCKKCGTIILKKKVAGRGTHYCPYCQK